MANIFEYIDYRQYLRDAYEERRKESPKFSYRFIAGKVGFSSPGFFANVLSGKKDISLKLALKFAELFKLGRKEKEYFETLVLFNKATGASEPILPRLAQVNMDVHKSRRDDKPFGIDQAIARCANAAGFRDLLHAAVLQ